MNAKPALRTLGIIAGALLAASSCFAAAPIPPDQVKAAETIAVANTTAFPDATAFADFDAIHSPIAGDDERYLIFGNATAPKPKPNLQPDLAAFLGRWEGYNYSPPVEKDWKYVLFVREISATGGRALFWAGTNLQYPAYAKDLQFAVYPGDTPTIRFDCPDQYGSIAFKFTYDSVNKQLRGWQRAPLQNDFSGPIDLGRDRSFTVYKDYPGYLADKGIYPREYRSEVLKDRYGNGYLVYLPEGYETHPRQTWPLIVFLHGSGDRGDNPFVLAKASPFMMIRERGPLPCIIVAPLLKASRSFSSFPDDYMNAVLEESLAEYRVDPRRVYLTGLSMGGEATYRFAARQPKRFAAIAPLAAFLSGPTDMEPIKDLPVWAIRGALDRSVNADRGRQPVHELKLAGGNVQFSELANHDHDVWTDTYSDPLFYNWLFQHMRPPDWLSLLFPIGGYVLLAGLIWFARDRLADFNIDLLSLCVIIVFIPLQSVFLTLRGSDADPLALTRIGGIAFWVIAASLFLALLLSRPRLARFSGRSIRWFAIGILAGLITSILLRYPVSVVISYSRPLDWSRLGSYFGQAAPGFFYQLGYVAVVNTLIRGFLWGYLRKIGWKDTWIWLFQAGLMMAGAAHYANSNPLFFWVIVPVNALVTGALVWQSKTVSSGIAAQATINTFGYTIGYIIALLK